MKNRLRLMSEGSGKTMIGLLLVALLALPVFCLHSRHVAFISASRNARMQSQELKKRVASLCAAMGVAHPIIGEPQFMVQKFNVRAPHNERRVWLVDCLAGAHGYSMIFNDLTGNIESIYSDGLTASSRGVGMSDRAVTSPGAALEGGVRRLKDLQMVPKGTRIALAERPECDRDGVTWRMTWKVLRPESAQPYDVRMTLNGNDATPMMVVNCRELEN